MRRRITANAVKQHRLRIGLHHIDAGIFANVEALPVERRPVAGLVDRHGRTGAADAGGASAELRACGQSARGQRLRPGQAHQSHTQDQWCHEIMNRGPGPAMASQPAKACCARGLALAAGMLAHGHQSAQTFGEDCFVCFGVHKEDMFLCTNAWPMGHVTESC